MKPKCEHNFEFLQVWSTKVSVSCTKCGMEVILGKKKADEIRRIIYKQSREHFRKGVKTLLEGKP